MLAQLRPLLLTLLAVTALIFLSLAAPSLAQDAGTVDPKPAPTLVLPTDQLWAYLASTLVTLPTYLVNKYGPQVSEPVKGLVLMLTTAVAAGVTQAITMGNVGFNQTTLQVVVTSVFVAFMAHKFVWQTTGIARNLGAGQNKPGQPEPQTFGWNH